MVKSLVSKLSTASSNLSLASTFSSVVGGGSGGSGSSGVQETNYAKHRNDPGRFFGDGVQFKAKLIGILEVGEARGDRMCQEALQDLKMAIRAAGEHKQRITIHVTIDGLRLRDEKTGDSLYHHPVHKISFIAQDMTDSRAFGYIFGSPDSGHRFFGIKTDKAASQVVLAMRDLFQVVFELKKKEIEMARQQIQGKTLHDHASQLASLSSLKSAGGHSELGTGTSSAHTLTMLGSLGASANGVSSETRLGVNLDVAKTSGAAAKELSPESVADLVDLEQELTSLQRGITQMERITPNESAAGQSAAALGKSASEDDPFGDSFIYVPSYNILPPPPDSGRTRHKPANKAESGSALEAMSTLLSPAPGASGSPATLQADDDDSWLHELEQQSDVFDTTKATAMGVMGLAALSGTGGTGGLPMAPLAASESTSTPTQQLSEASALADVELSSLGLSGTEFAAAGSDSAQAATMSEPVGASAKQTSTTCSVLDDPVLLPRDTDPFSPTRKKSDPDPFQDGDLFSKLDAFEFDTAATSAVAESGVATGGNNSFNGPLQVQLPPESGSGISPTPPPPAPATTATWKADISRLERQMTEAVTSSVRTRPTAGGGGTGLAALPPGAALKQQTVDVISSISNKKMPHLFGQARFSKRDNNSSVNMRRLQESDSLSENETAPEPPPRPDSAPYSEPPPLPPKKQFSDIVIRPHTTPAAMPSSSAPGGRYEYLNNTTSSLRRSAAAAAAATDVPPIPLPSRRVGRSDGYFPGPGRPRKPGHTEDDYLAPVGHTASGAGAGSADVPPLLPPPIQSSTRARPQRQQSLGKPQDIYENKAEIMQAQQAREKAEAAALAPDITLTQLLTLGIDELAVKLNVPTTKLSTMTLVELTAYLSEYLSTEQARPLPRQVPSASPIPAAASSTTAPTSAVFKVNFDQQTAFVAKFDDTFGEDMGAGAQDAFVANFANFNETPVAATTAPGMENRGQVPAVPPADRYAVFREIIDQELQQQHQDTDLMGDLTPPPVADTEELGNVPQEKLDVDGFISPPEQQVEQPPLPKIDTKITEVVAQAKDRYAALRDIILVENLFDKQQSGSAGGASREKDLMQDFPEFSDEFNEDQDLRQIMDNRASSTGPDRRGLVDSRGFPAEPSSSALTVDDDDDEDAGGESSLDSNDKDAEVTSAQDQYEKLSASTQQLDGEKVDSKPDADDISDVTKLTKQDHKFLTVTSASGIIGPRDDIEIDDLMQRAISNLSLDSRDRTSPANSTGAASAPSRGPHTLHTPSQFNDVSTSPIPLHKSPQPHGAQVSPVPSHLSAVSQLIDTATKQMGDRDSDASKAAKDSWATFDSPKAAAYELASEKRARQTLKPSVRSNTLNLPPPPPSNTSQQDTAESPCSSDPRDEGWSKQPGSMGGRRWPKKERQQTSSSSRDLSPWDDETPEYLKQQRRLPPGMQAQVTHPERLGFYTRHARRMNSCDEDYDYDEEYATRRDQQRKLKHVLSRSRDNFELDSPSWYHHPAHHTWSPQEIEQGVRARSFERSAYERSTYGPPIYDKRGNPVPGPAAGGAGYDRRAYGYRLHRDYQRPNYDFDDYGGEYRGEKLNRRTDYENVYDGRRSPMDYKGRGDYMYERERKSFDRESVESFESATRRRRSFGSGGDVYGSLDSREDYRDRYLGGSTAELKTRSLRKPSKLRATGDIDFEHDSENDFHHPQQPPPLQQPRGGRSLDTRSLQRPSQLGSEVAGGAGAQPRLRKSSGSSPWDGEEPSLPGQKSWKRPSSAAETERRLAESRRAAALAQTPSDGEKDRRFRKKTRARSAKDLANVGNIPCGHRGRGVRDNYVACQNDEDNDDEDYVDDEEYEEEPPTDEDKFERLNRRRHEMHQRMLESERRQMHAQGLGKIPPPPLSALKSSLGMDVKRYAGSTRSGVTDYGFVDSYEQTPTPRSNASSSAVMTGDGNGSSGKFNFDDGFESDFNQSSPPPAPAGTASSCTSTPAGPVSGSSVAGGSTSKSLFRFSNDFSEREKLQQQQQQQQPPSFDMETPQTSTPPITQKLRFDDNVKVSQFDDAAFEDDFAKASFEFEKEEATQQWTQASNNGAAAPASAAMSRKQNIRNSKLQQRQELIKKSESVNIFAKKNEDPFEDDEFFKSPTAEEEAGAGDKGAGNGGSDGNSNKFQWAEDNNFAKFDENM
ncbi:protein disabled [Scaptodrosophila lebanonensis]|uniref:Protein disabled n=1 Tax=Drosophila lebanonensis TaxID=7225 RepID=A0A6J2UGB9_DROLE|nr:protein disabled [Scaptodrosophila lebanonensis]